MPTKRKNKRGLNLQNLREVGDFFVVAKLFESNSGKHLRLRGGPIGWSFLVE